MRDRILIALAVMTVTAWLIGVDVESDIDRVEELPLTAFAISVPEPESQTAMINSILSSAPAQHATQARFVKIPGSEIDILTQAGDFEYCRRIQCYKSYNAFLAWVGGAWNWKDWEFVNQAGGGHNDYTGNDLYKANLVDTYGVLSVHWSRAIEPSPLVSENCSAPVSGPSSSHNYASSVYVESRDEYYHSTTGPSHLKSPNCIGTPDTVGAGQWITDTSTWAQITHDNQSYGRTCYHRNADKIYTWNNGNRLHILDPANNYAITEISQNRGWWSNASKWDVAMDQINDICYIYAKGLGVFGDHYDPATGQRTNSIFRSNTKKMLIPSLSVEHSTGNLVAVGKGGYVLHIDTKTGVDIDISAPNGMPRGKYIYGKFDMIESIACVGIGLGDARDGVYLMTLPKSVCTMGAAAPTEPVPPVVPAPPVPGSAFLDKCRQQGVVFCDPLSTHGPYAVNNGVLAVLTNPDGSEGVPSGSWWREWRGVQSFDDNAAGYDAEHDALKVVFKQSGSKSGLFTTNFSRDLKTQFKEGDTYFLQFQVRYNCDYIYTDCNPESDNYKKEHRPIVNKSGSLQAAKIAIIGEGDHVAGKSVGACERQQIVINTSKNHTLSGFHNCGRYAAFKKSTGKTVGGSKQLDWQFGGDYRCLRYPDDKTHTKATWGVGGTGPNCATLESGQWMTIQMRVTIGQWQKEWSGSKLSNIKFWFALENEPQKKALDLDVYLSPPAGSAIGYGKIWFQIHSTKAKAAPSRPDSAAWYRNMVVSESYIGD